MTVTKGGKKRNYKKPGRLSARKCYQIYSRQQMRSALVPTASGGWGSDGQLSQKISNVYACQRNK